MERATQRRKEFRRIKKLFELERKVKIENDKEDEEQLEDTDKFEKVIYNDAIHSERPPYI